MFDQQVGYDHTARALNSSGPFDFILGIDEDFRHRFNAKLFGGGYGVLFIGLRLCFIGTFIDI